MLKFFPKINPKYQHFCRILATNIGQCTLKIRIPRVAHDFLPL